MAAGLRGVSLTREMDSCSQLLGLVLEVFAKLKVRPAKQLSHCLTSKALLHRPLGVELGQDDIIVLSA